MCYDITDRCSFEDLCKWIKNIEKYADGSIIILSGNKLDLQEKREVSYEEGLQFAQQYGFQFFETSAKEDLNVNNLFENAMKEYSQTHHPIYRQPRNVNLRTGQNANNGY